MRSLRARLFVYLVGGGVVLLLGAGLALVWTISAWLEHDLDRSLLIKARTLVALIELDGERIDFEFDERLLPEFGTSAEPEYFELWLADGSLFQRSPSFEVDDRRRATLGGTPTPATTPDFRDVPLPDGRAGRQVRLDFVPRRVDDDGALPPPARSERTATVLVARERESLDADVAWLSIAIAIAAAVLMLALAALTHAALRVGLRSLDRLDREVRALDVGSLASRVDVPRPPREIAAVVEQINALLDRLERGFRRERQLSSDIAHELKTPVAELRSLCDVGSAWPDDVATAREFFQDARAIALAMERIVVHLVALARYDEGREPVATSNVSVLEVVDAAWRPLAGAAAAKRLRYRREIPPAVSFETDPYKFPLIVANLLSNAVAYTPPGGVVVCMAEQTNGRASVTFENQTHNLESGDLAVMFDRFWRKDEARTSGYNVGLGLSLVRAMTDLLGIEVATRLEPDRIFRITLRGPSGRSVRSGTAPASPRPTPRPLDGAPRPERSSRPPA